MHFDLQTMIAEEDKAVCIGIISGTHGQPFQGSPATHRLTGARHIHVLAFNDVGLISEHLAGRADITLLQQLRRVARRLPPASTDTSPEILPGVHARRRLSIASRETG